MQIHVLTHQPSRVQPSAFPSPWQPVFPGCPGTESYVCKFWVWPLLQTIMLLLRVIPATDCVIAHSFYLWVSSPSRGGSSSLMHSPVRGPLGCFQWGVILTKAALSICRQVRWTSVFTSSGAKPRSSIAGSRGERVFNYRTASLFSQPTTWETFRGSVSSSSPGAARGFTSVAVGAWGCLTGLVLSILGLDNLSSVFSCFFVGCRSFRLRCLFTYFADFFFFFFLLSHYC